jgi:peroxiredoxin
VTQQNQKLDPAALASVRLPIAYWLLVSLTLGVGFGGIAVIVVRVLQAPPPAHDIAAGARKMLLLGKGAPLSEPLQTILAQWNTYSERTQSHPLLDKPAPDFTLTDSNDKPFRLSDAWARGPVVLVFYYGYFCDHCVAQLFGLNDDLKYFRELGAEVVAVSPDLPEETRKKFAEYKNKGGAFSFPVLSDPKNKAAELFGAYKPFEPGRPEISLHGTFLIDRSGIVRWCNLGESPFTNNRSLLGDLAKLEGRMPQAPRNPGGTR